MLKDLVDSGTTVLLTTQYLEEADRLADRIGVINEGRIISEGTTDELKSTLGSGSIEVGLNGDDQERVIAALRRVGDGNPAWDAERRRVVVPAPEGSLTLMDVVRELDAEGVRPADLAIHRPTLDDVFLSLTGSSPGPAPDPDGDRSPTEGADA